MTWFLLASCTALFEALKDVASKQSLKSLDEYVVLWAFTGVGALALVPVLLLTTGWPEFGPRFGWAALFGGSLNVFAYLCYIRAIKIADLSLTVPLVSLTPLFLLVTSPLIVQEYPSWGDVFGVVVLIVGSYVLNLQTTPTNEPRSSYWAPLRAMATNPGSRLMLMVAFVWSITSNIDKVGVQNSSPLMWVIVLFSCVSCGTLPFALRRGKGAFVQAFAQAKLLGLTGLLNIVGVGFQMWALTLAPVTQVIAVKRMSTLIAVLFGVFWFGESGLRERLLGAAIMVAGVALISLT